MGRPKKTVEPRTPQPNIPEPGELDAALYQLRSFRSPIIWPRERFAWLCQLLAKSPRGMQLLALTYTEEWDPGECAEELHDMIVRAAYARAYDALVHMEHFRVGDISPQIEGQQIAVEKRLENQKKSVVSPINERFPNESAIVKNVAKHQWGIGLAPRQFDVLLAAVFENIPLTEEALREHGVGARIARRLQLKDLNEKAKSSNVTAMIDAIFKKVSQEAARRAAAAEQKDRRSMIADDEPF